MHLNMPLRQIPKIGPFYQKKLEKMGIKTVRDLLWHFPVRYQDFSHIQPIAKIKVNQQCSACGKIIEIKNSRTWKKKMIVTEALLEDKTGALRAVWFNQPFLIRNLKKSDEVCLAGKLALGKDGPFLSSPVYEKVYSQELTHTGRLVPIYPETKGVSSRWLRYVLKPLLQGFKNQIAEILPEYILKQEKLLDINQAIQQIHFPDSLKQAQQAKQRLAFEELFLIELVALAERLKLSQEKAPAVNLNIELAQRFAKSLSFKLTDSQRKCAWQILKDLEKPRPMSRLLEGDVGSGKTVVAVLAILQAAKAGFQAGFMAPTEILAKQHFTETAKLLRPFKIKIALLTGKQDKIISQKLGCATKTGFKPEILEISRNKVLEKAKNGEIDLLIGTHALIQDKVKFGNLALAVIDEQHRFGIKQRANLISPNALGQKLIPHLLSMTATPIPRTLALTVYGDLDLSLLDQMPKGRKPVITETVPASQRKQTYQFVRRQIKAGRQAFVICPRIEKPEDNPDNPSKANAWTEAKAVKQEYEKLSKEVFPDLKLEMLHGKMKTKEKEKIMENFKNKKFDILVSTSVVEVGVDVPNAAVMIIEGAERFGLAQLHQFRGRVGRSKFQSYCFLFTDSPAKTTRARLKAIKLAKNGFELAENDLKIRGPGSLFGAKQWGMPDLAMQNLADLALVEKTRELARQILAQSPDLKKYPLLKEYAKQFKTKIHFE